MCILVFRSHVGLLSATAIRFCLYLQISSSVSAEMLPVDGLWNPSTQRALYRLAARVLLFVTMSETESDPLYLHDNTSLTLRWIGYGFHAVIYIIIIRL